MNVSDIPNTGTAALLAFYNANSGKPLIKKFQDRATAERRVADLIADLSEAPAAEVAEVAEVAEAPAENSRNCPFCGAEEGNITAAGPEGTIAGDTRNFCHICSAEWNIETGKRYNAPAKSETLSASVRASWENPDVRRARSTKDKVAVGDAVYPSLRVALETVRMTPSNFIAFRKELKAKGVARLGDYEFKIVII